MTNHTPEVSGRGKNGRDFRGELQVDRKHAGKEVVCDHKHSVGRTSLEVLFDRRLTLITDGGSWTDPTDPAILDPHSLRPHPPGWSGKIPRLSEYRGPTLELVADCQ